MPDIHWDIGEGQERETVAKANSAQRPRRNWIALLLAVILGIGFGTWFHALPEPAPRPTPAPALTPTPLPTPAYPAIPAKLYQAIDEEAQALANGDLETVIALHMPQAEPSIIWQRHNFTAWGRPAGQRPLYAILNYGLRTPLKAWVDIRQFRQGRSFRETRFYHWQGDRWLRSEPDPFFWSEQTETLETAHFHVNYLVEDRAFIRPILSQLEKTQVNLCANLECGTTPLRYTLKFSSGVTSNWPLSSDEREIRFASPRVLGMYEDATPLDGEGLNLIWTLAWTTAVQRTYGLVTQVNDRPNSPLFWAINRWATLHASVHPNLEWLATLKIELPRNPLSLEIVWDHLTSGSYQTLYNLVEATTHFIEQEYGSQANPQLLQALATAQSFPEVIETGLGVPFAEFDRKWQGWVKHSVFP